MLVSDMFTLWATIYLKKIRIMKCQCMIYDIWNIVINATFSHMCQRLTKISFVSRYLAGSMRFFIKHYFVYHNLLKKKKNTNHEMLVNDMINLWAAVYFEKILLYIYFCYIPPHTQTFVISSRYKLKNSKKNFLKVE